MQVIDLKQVMNGNRLLITRQTVSHSLSLSYQLGLLVRSDIHLGPHHYLD